MAQCITGEVEYRGYCLPSYLTPAEMEARYQEILAEENRKRKHNSFWLAVLAILSVIGLAFVVLQFNA